MMLLLLLLLAMLLLLLLWMASVLVPQLLQIGLHLPQQWMGLCFATALSAALPLLWVLVS